MTHPNPTPHSAPGLVFAAIAPHGSLAVPEAIAPEEVNIAQATRDGMAELGRRFTRARPDAVVVVTPHNVHIEGAMAVILAGELAGNLNDWSPQQVALKVPTERRLARDILEALRAAGIQAVGVSYGGNDQAGATAPLDWGALIPLWHMGGRHTPPSPAVLVCPARDLSWEAHVQAGAAIAEAARSWGGRVALIASADHGHGHRADGPYGYAPASAQYDAQVMGLIERHDLAGLLNLDPGLVKASLADSFWQLLMLHGALQASSGSAAWTHELLSYEAPTYFGMACAAYERAGEGNSPQAK